jgi:hypothetical protein
MSWESNKVRGNLNSQVANIQDKIYENVDRIGGKKVAVAEDVQNLM